MTLEVKRKQRENTQSLIRRFSQKIRKSGVLIQARKVRFLEKEKSDLAKKRAALRKIELRKEYEKMKKLGKIKKKYKR